MSAAVTDLTSAELRLLLAPAVAAAAAFDGWSARALDAAAGQCGVSPAVARFAFEAGGGAGGTARPARSLSMALIEAWIAHIDAAMTDEFPADCLAAVPVRDRVRRLVWFRLEQWAGHEEALARALAVLAMPQNASRVVVLGWASADAMWRLAGDTAADYNHYTKRALLAGMYAASLAVYARDESEGKAETRDFLDRRIAGVMRFEKIKARVAGGLGPAPFSMAGFLGRLRYPAQ